MNKTKKSIGAKKPSRTKKSTSAKKLASDINEVVSYVDDCIDMLQCVTKFKVNSLETNVSKKSFNISCEMKGDEYGFVRIYTEYSNGVYNAYLSYNADDNDNDDEMIGDMVITKDKSSMIDYIQGFVECVDQKIRETTWNPRRW